MKGWYLAGVVVLPLVAASLQAQSPPATQPIDSGTLVRVELSDHSVIRGRLLNRYVPGAPTLRVCLYPGRPCAAGSDDRVRAIPVGELTRFDVAAGTHARPGAILGAIIGLGLGEAAYGLWIAYTRTDRGPPIRFSVRLVRPDGTDDHELVRPGAGLPPADSANDYGVVGQMVWSPDGTELAFGRRDSVWLVRTDGSGLRAIMAGAGVVRPH